jgi:hypothetical protein
MKVFITAVKLDDHKNDHTYSYAHCQTGNIDQGGAPVARHIPESCFKEISEHST